MTPLRLVAIGAIFFFTTIGWMILGGTVVERTGESDGRIRSEVEALWGSTHRQAPPAVTVDRRITRLVRDVAVVDKQETVTTRQQVTTAQKGTELLSSLVDVKLDLEHRKKGLLWWPTYEVAFAGHYRYALPARELVDGVSDHRTDGNDGTGVVDTVQIVLPLSAENAVYDGFHVTVDGAEHTPQPGGSERRNSFFLTLPRNKDVVDIDVRYKSRGLGTWVYSLGQNGQTSQLKDFALALTTNVSPVDFPVGTLSPTTKAAVAGGGEQLAWRFDSLVTGKDIGLELPARLNPGPVAARISFFAPVSLLFFFTVMVILGVVRKQSLHPMNYFFLAGAFFAFHLLFAYLVDVVDLGVAFAISGASSVFLVTSYLRIVQGAKVAFLQAGTAQMVFLIGFSLAFFREGQSGLTIAIGSVVTLFLLMQLTARVKWVEIFGGSDVVASGSSVGVPGFQSPMPPKPATDTTTSTS